MSVCFYRQLPDLLICGAGSNTALSSSCKLVLRNNCNQLNMHCELQVHGCLDKEPCCKLYSRKYVIIYNDLDPLKSRQVIAGHVPLSKWLHTEKPLVYRLVKQLFSDERNAETTGCCFWLGWKGASRSSLGLSLLVTPGHLNRLIYCSFARQFLHLPMWQRQELRLFELLAPVLLLHCKWQRMQLCDFFSVVHFKRLHGNIYKA